MVAPANLLGRCWLVPLNNVVYVFMVLCVHLEEKNCVSRGEHKFLHNFYFYFRLIFSSWKIHSVRIRDVGVLCVCQGLMVTTTTVTIMMAVVSVNGLVGAQNGNSTHLCVLWRTFVGTIWSLLAVEVLRGFKMWKYKIFIYGFLYTTRNGCVKVQEDTFNGGF